MINLFKTQFTFEILGCIWISDSNCFGRDEPKTRPVRRRAQTASPLSLISSHMNISDRQISSIQMVSCYATVWALYVFGIRKQIWQTDSTALTITKSIAKDNDLISGEKMRPKRIKRTEYKMSGKTKKFIKVWHQIYQKRYSFHSFLHLIGISI